MSHGQKAKAQALAFNLEGWKAAAAVKLQTMSALKAGGEADERYSGYQKVIYTKTP